MPFLKLELNLYLYTPPSEIYLYLEVRRVLLGKVSFIITVTRSRRAFLVGIQLRMRVEKGKFPFPVFRRWGLLTFVGDLSSMHACVHVGLCVDSARKANFGTVLHVVMRFAVLALSLHCSRYLRLLPPVYNCVKMSSISRPAKLSFLDFDAVGVDLDHTLCKYKLDNTFSVNHSSSHNFHSPNHANRHTRP